MTPLFRVTFSALIIVGTISCNDNNNYSVRINSTYIHNTNKTRYVVNVDAHDRHSLILRTLNDIRSPLISSESFRFILNSEQSLYCIAEGTTKEVKFNGDHYGNLFEAKICVIDDVTYVINNERIITIDNDSFDIINNVINISKCDYMVYNKKTDSILHLNVFKDVELRQFGLLVDRFGLWEFVPYPKGACSGDRPIFIAEGENAIFLCAERSFMTIEWSVDSQQIKNYEFVDKFITKINLTYDEIQRRATSSISNLTISAFEVANDTLYYGYMLNNAYNICCVRNGDIMEMVRWSLIRNDHGKPLYVNTGKISVNGEDISVSLACTYRNASKELKLILTDYLLKGVSDE